MTDPKFALFNKEHEGVSILYLMNTTTIVFPSLRTVHAKKHIELGFEDEDCLRVTRAVSPKVFSFPVDELGFVHEREGLELRMDLEHLVLQLHFHVLVQGLEQL